MSLDANFKSAAETVRKFSKRPPDNEMLEIYSLYKQATLGDVNIPKPSEVQASLKWEAWNKKKGMSSNTAKEQYVAKIKKLSSSYA